MTDRTARCWGWYAYGQLGNGTTTNASIPVTVSGVTDAVKIAGGYAHVCVTAAGGVVRCWGLNNYGQLGDGTATNRTTSVVVSGVVFVLSSIGMCMRPLGAFD